MRIKAVNNIIGGEILAEAILTEKKEVLIPKGTELKMGYIPLIESLGIEYLCIEDPYKNFEVPHSIIETDRVETYVLRVRKIMERHIYHSTNSALNEYEEIANDILDDVLSTSEEFVIDMNERTANLYEHTVMVTLLSVFIAKKLRLDRKRQYNIALGCLLHDIGIRFITVPYKNIDQTKMRSTTLAEYKKHTVLGFSALDHEDWIPAISKLMVLSHHERLDGTGFPMRQKNRDTECKIIQVVDAFDCYISGMECKRITVQQALERIVSESGVKYDDKIVEALVTAIAKYPVGTTVKTNAEVEQGVVVSQTADSEKPIIMLLDDKKIEEKDRMNLLLEKDVSILQVI